MDGDRLKNIESKLDTINDKLETIAVQDERIKNVESQVATLWKKYDQLADPNTGQIPKLTSWQASCPRAQMKWLWMVVIPMGFTQIALGIALIARIL